MTRRHRFGQLDQFTGDDKARSSRSVPTLRWCRLHAEPLEERRLLTITVDTLVDEADGSIIDGDVSLRDAIALAPPGETIDFSVAGTILLELGELAISKDLLIDGPGADLLTIDAGDGGDATPATGDGFRIFNVNDFTAATHVDVTIQGLTLTGGDVAGPGGAIRSEERLTVLDTVITGNAATGSFGSRIGDGAGIYARTRSGGATLISGNTITYNLATDDGGGISAYTSSGGTLMIDGNTISSNQSHVGGAFHGVGYGTTISGNVMDDNRAQFGRGGGIYFYRGGVTITGNALNRNYASDGGGIYTALYADGQHTEISQNTLTENYVLADGGGIWLNNHATATASVVDNVILDNTALDNGGGIFSTDPGLAGSATFDGNTIQGNHAGDDGGGMWLRATGNTTITRSIISGNRASDNGGGVALHRYTDYPDVAITDTTISANTARIDGGGLFINHNGAPTTIRNVTIAGNAADRHGGGIAATGSALAHLDIMHSTVVDNTSDADIDSDGHGGGAHFPNAVVGRLLDHTIVAQNHNGDNTADDVYGDVSPASAFNLIGADTNLVGIGNGIAGNQIGTAASPIDPHLGPLMYNGGPVLFGGEMMATQMPLPDSPVLDAGDPLFAGPPANDQRGTPTPRVIGPAIDIGAIESSALVVDTLLDEDDGDHSPGDLSLREAIGTANSSLGVFDWILFDSALDGGTILLTMGDLSIVGSVRIDAGALSGGLTIDASGNDPTPDVDNGDGSRVLSINDGDDNHNAYVFVESLTLTGGDTGGGGGAILSSESLSLLDSLITGNATTGGGGGINLRTMTGAVTMISRSSFQQNVAGYGGGIYSHTAEDGDTTIVDTTIEQNAVTERGGGIVAETEAGGTFTIATSSVAGNDTVDGAGGGAWLLGDGTSLIINTTISGNTAYGATGDGGGIWASTSAGTTSITNSTVSGNTASARGGGLFTSTAVGGSTTIQYSTIVGNTADVNNAGGLAGGGVSLVGAAPARLDHTIVADNYLAAATRDDVDGSVDASSHHNLIGVDASLVGISDGIDGNQIGTVATPLDPQLGPLADNGGETMTHLPANDSPAVNAGDFGVTPALAFDQRGEPFARRVGAAVDIGAVELQDDSIAVTITVDTLVDEDDGDHADGDFSLREAVAIGNENPLLNIEFDESLHGGTILLTMGELEITNSLMISGPGADLLTIDASGNDPTPELNNGDGARVFSAISHLIRFDISISGLTLTGGDVDGSGGAILSGVKLNLTDTQIIENAATQHGGGVVLNSAAAGTSVVARSEFTNNQAGGDGGGLWLRNMSSQQPDIHIVDSTFHGNTASRGGGIFSTAFSGILTIDETTISGNHAVAPQGDGGGAYLRSQAYARARITSSTISANTAYNDGGGIRANNSVSDSITLEHVTVTRNSAEGQLSGVGGGGLFLPGEVPLVLDHTIVAGNSAEVGATAPDLSGGFDAQHSLVGNDAGATIVDSGGNLLGTAATPIDPLLSPLSNNGGHTQTHLPLPGSPVIDAGDSSFAAPPLTDQRGFYRVIDGNADDAPRIDIGAAEYGSIAPVPGDGNLDGQVNGLDYVLWALHFGDDPADDPPGTPLNGDFNGDGVVNGLDYVTWATNFGSAVSVPSTTVKNASGQADHQLAVVDLALEDDHDTGSTIVDNLAIRDWQLSRAFDSLLKRRDKKDE